MRVFCSLKRSELPPELRLILSCLRITPTEKEVQQIEELSRAKIGWPDLLRWVDRHRVAPLVYQNLKRYGGNGVPASAMGALRSRFESNAHRSLANARELVRLDKLFRENGVASSRSREAYWPYRFMATWLCAMPGTLTSWLPQARRSLPTDSCKSAIAAACQVFG